jgi:hypothetical protein
LPFLPDFATLLPRCNIAGSGRPKEGSPAARPRLVEPWQCLQSAWAVSLGSQLGIEAARRVERVRCLRKGRRWQQADRTIHLLLPDGLIALQPRANRQTDRHTVAARAIRLTVSISRGALNGFSIRISSQRSTGRWHRRYAVRNINGMPRARSA